MGENEGTNPCACAKCIESRAAVAREGKVKPYTLSLKYSVKVKTQAEASNLLTTMIGALSMKELGEGKVKLVTAIALEDK